MHRRAGDYFSLLVYISGETLVDRIGYETIRYESSV